MFAPNAPRPHRGEAKNAYQNRSWEVAPGDEGTAEGEEGLMDVGAPLIADGQASKVVEPGQGALDHPAMTTEAIAALDALAAMRGAICRRRSRARQKG